MCRDALRPERHQLIRRERLVPFAGEGADVLGAHSLGPQRDELVGGQGGITERVHLVDVLWGDPGAGHLEHALEREGTRLGLRLRRGPGLGLRIGLGSRLRVLGRRGR